MRIGCHIYPEQLDCQMRGCLWERGICVDTISTTTNPATTTAEEPGGTGEENIFIQILAVVGAIAILLVLLLGWLCWFLRRVRLAVSGILVDPMAGKGEETEKVKEEAEKKAKEEAEKKAKEEAEKKAKEEAEKKAKEEALKKHVEFEQHFDFSKISDKCGFFQMFPDDPGLKTRNAGKLGLLKIEAIDYREGCFTKSKVYDLIDGHGNEEKRAKGVSRTEMVNIDYSVYTGVRVNNDVVHVKSKMIRSYDHNLCQISVKKLGFHSLSMSRAFVAPNLSYPFGHYKLQEDAME